MWCNFDFYQRVRVDSDEAFFRPEMEWEVYPWRAVHPQTGTSTLGWNKQTVLSFDKEMGMRDGVEVWLNPGNPPPTGRGEFEDGLDAGMWGLYLRTGILDEYITTYEDRSVESNPGHPQKTMGCTPKEFWRKIGGVWERGYNCFFPCSGESG